MKKIIRYYLLLAAFYLVADALLHLINFRLVDVENTWPEPAVVYGEFMERIYGSFVLIVAAMAFLIQSNLEKYKTAAKVAAIWGLFHGALLIYTSITTNFSTLYKDTPSVIVYIPFYNGYLLFESLIVIGFSILVLLHWKKL